MIGDSIPPCGTPFLSSLRTKVPRTVAVYHVTISGSKPLSNSALDVKSMLTLSKAPLISRNTPIATPLRLRKAFSIFPTSMLSAVSGDLPFLKPCCLLFKGSSFSEVSNNRQYIKRSMHLKTKDVKQIGLKLFGME